MARTWSLRQGVTKSNDEAAKQGCAGGDVATAEVVHSGDFTIDLTHRRVRLRGNELQLSSEEFDVLVFLVSHPQRLVTPRTILATSWTGNGVHQAEFLRSLLSLSSKLDAAGASGHHYLRTEPWVLYRFDPTSSSAA